MMDTRETNDIVKGNESLEEDLKNTSAAMETSTAIEGNVEIKENEVEEETSEVAETSFKDYSRLTKAQIISQLEKIVEQSADVVKKDVDLLKQAFYKLHKAEIDKKKKAFIEAGGLEEAFVVEEDSLEEMLKNLLTVYKEKRSFFVEEQEKQKEECKKAQLIILDKLKELTDSPSDINKVYNDFKKLQGEWHDLKQKAQAISNEMWKNYQLYVEKFYDFVKINNEFREYDFKKNLEIKTALCESVERLLNEEDVISAFHQLQKFHQEWRDTGPVAKDLREDLWQRFKEASSQINKKHQLYYENIRAKELKNLEEKQSICDKLEAINYEELKLIKDWESKTKEIVNLQEYWKTIGFAPKKNNVKIFEKFRGLCDIFFKKKGEFYKSIKEDMVKNLEAKTVLCEKAEALKDSTDWREVSDTFIKLQKDWKTIGPVSRKHSEAIWKRFSSACDFFFEQRTKATSSQKGEEQQNLEKKKAIIEAVKALDTALPQEEAVAKIREFISEWNAVGFVPYKEKDIIYKEYHAAIDAQYDRLSVSESNRKLSSFKDSVAEMAGEKNSTKLYRERERLMRIYESMKSELQTCENNIGFFNFSGKGKGVNPLMKEMERKITKLKEDIELIVKKIDVIDHNMEK